MTGYTVHTGSTEKFASGWDQIFRKAGKRAGRKANSARGQSAARKKAKSRGK